MTKIEALELELAARKMVDGTELHWWKLIKLAGSNDLVIDYAHLDRYNREHLRLAIGIIEGRPVWEGDRYYDTSSSKIIGRTLIPLSSLFPLTHIARGGLPQSYWNGCSWLPPKPKTGMVELSIEDIKAAAYQHKFYVERIAEACRKALESLK